MAALRRPSRATESAPLRVWVDRERARFGAWYEMFPRSAGPDPTGAARSARRAAELRAHRRPGLRRASICRRSIRSARSFRKGRNNALVAGPGDPGQPVGDRLGRRRPHRDRARARHARRLRRLRRRGRSGSASRSRSTSPGSARPTTRGSREHPEWFRHRPDGTIKYAENPPKKYQDIYPFDFECEDWRGAVAGAARRHAVLGRATACGSSASTTRTPRRSASGNG